MDEQIIQNALTEIRALVKENETDFDIKPLVKIVEDIMRSSTNKDDNPQDKKPFFKDKSLGNKRSRDELVAMINTFAWELQRSCSSDEINIDEEVLDLFRMLSSYSWPGKAVIALSAFAINYGEFWLVEQLSKTDPGALSLVILEQLPTTMEKKKSDLEPVTNMIASILDLTTCFSESVDKIFPSKHLKSDSSRPLLEELRAQIQSCTYWIIRSILICQSQLANENIKLISELSEVSTKLSDMVEKVSQMRKSLRGQMDSCLKEAEKNRQEEIYKDLKNTVENLTKSKMVEKDNMSILKALIPGHSKTPLYNGSSKDQVEIDSLTKKAVLLYFSDLKQCNVELPVLLEVYKNKPNKGPYDYEILWIPMVENSSTENDEKFHNIREDMTWFSISDLKLVEPAVIRFIREDWKSNRRSKIVVISPQGMLMSLEAIHMLLIWGKSARFPFDKRCAKELWGKEKWSVDFLLDNIEVEPLTQWINDEKYVCLYGGEDSERILEFHEKILNTSRKAKIDMKMLYMGTSNKSGIIKTNIDLISSKELSIKGIDPAKIQLFWTRIDCMWHSLVLAGKVDDEIMRWVLKMRSFDCSGRGWAIISKGYYSSEMASGMGDTMMKCLSEYNLWESNVGTKGFVPALKEHISSVGPIKSTTNTFSVPNIADGLSMKTECFECQKEMQRLTRFNCSGD